MGLVRRIVAWFKPPCDHEWVTVERLTWQDGAGSWGAWTLWRRHGKYFALACPYCDTERDASEVIWGEWKQVGRFK
jgi:hypothetical protein